MSIEDLERRKVIKGLGAGLLAATAGVPFFAMAQDETLVRFLDMPEDYDVPPVEPGSTHIINTREITNFYSRDFYVVQHYGQPEVPMAQYKLELTGLVDRPLSFTLEELKAMPSREIDAGFECGGNGGRMFQGLVGNARWRGVSLREILNQAGIQELGREVVFFGADQGTEEIRGRQVEQSFARSLSVEDALHEDNLIVYEMNGMPLAPHHGYPVRMLIPGFYGVANVKWLTQIHVQDTRYMGRFMGRDYVTLKHENVGGEDRWMETSVARMNLKSAIVRVTRRNNVHRISGFALNDGTPIRSIEVKIDDGPWMEAMIDPQASQYSWKPFHYEWRNATPGEHTIVSRVTDINGRVQLPQDQLPERVSYWEEFGQFPRRVLIEG